MAYTIINAGHLRTLEALVNLKMTEGWVPTGGVYSVPKPIEKEYIYQIDKSTWDLEQSERVYESNTNFMQAMVLIED